MTFCYSQRYRLLPEILIYRMLRYVTTKYSVISSLTVCKRMIDNTALAESPITDTMAQDNYAANLSFLLCWNTRCAYIYLLILQHFLIIFLFGNHVFFSIVARHCISISGSVHCVDGQSTLELNFRIIYAPSFASKL